MATVEVTPPFPFFTDLRSGVPIDAGYVYIGEANQDPASKPVAVFWDSALTIPAPNPVRTSAGYLRRSGSPGTVFVGGTGDYSMMVADKGNTPLYTVPSRRRAGLGDITLTAGEQLLVEAGAGIRLRDGSTMTVGDNTGVGVVTAYAANARFTGDIVPAGASNVGSASKRVGVFADALNASTATLGDTQMNGSVEVAAGQSNGSIAAPWLTTNTLSENINNLAVYRTADTSGAGDYAGLLFDSARDRLLAAAHQTSAGAVAVLGGDPYNVVSIARTAPGVYDVTFRVPLSSLSYVKVEGSPAIGVAPTGFSWTSTTVLNIRTANSAGVATDMAFDVQVRGAASLTGVAGITSPF